MEFQLVLVQKNLLLVIGGLILEQVIDLLHMQVLVQPQFHQVTQGYMHTVRMERMLLPIVTEHLVHLKLVVSHLD